MGDAIITKLPQCQCGTFLDPAKADANSNIKCVCGILWNYRPEKVVCSFLEFRCDDKISDPIKIVDSVIIGRDPDDRNYIKITSNDGEPIANTYIRNMFVSKSHIGVLLREEYKLLLDSKKIIRKNKCSIKDLESTHGTKLNTHPLSALSPSPLKNGDKVVLAPGTPSPLTIIFNEKPEE